MNLWIWVVSTLGLVGSATWLGHLVHLARHRALAIFLGDLPDDALPGGWPSLAVLFAARDEAEGVELACRSMLAQEYPGLEVIAVDDRSTDGTGAILDRLAIEEPRLRVVHIAELPAGWLGKTNALQLGSASTGARWLLLTDADVILAPGVLKKAVAHAESNGLGHLAIAPEVTTESSGERLFLALFGVLFSMYAPIGKLGDMSSKAHVGIGAFNLVRLESFRAIGGFRHLALSVDDDMRLGEALKFAGYRPGFLLGRGAVSVRWQVGLGGMIRGLEKNFFAGLGYRLDKVLVVALGMLGVGIGPFLGLIFGPSWVRVACGLGVASMAILLGASARQSRIGWYYVFAMPLAAVALLVSLARSVVLTIARDGVRWRGHHYPLEDLRRHVRLREAWTREVWKSTR